MAYRNIAKMAVNVGIHCIARGKYLHVMVHMPMDKKISLRNTVASSNVTGTFFSAMPLSQHDNLSLSS